MDVNLEINQWHFGCRVASTSAYTGPHLAVLRANCFGPWCWLIYRYVHWNTEVILIIIESALAVNLQLSTHVLRTMHFFPQTTTWQKSLKSWVSWLTGQLYSALKWNNCCGIDFLSNNYCLLRQDRILAQSVRTRSPAGWPGQRHQG